jgi:hypothetical protein
VVAIQVAMCLWHADFVGMCMHACMQQHPSFRGDEGTTLLHHVHDVGPVANQRDAHTLVHARLVDQLRRKQELMHDYRHCQQYMSQVLLYAGLLQPP